jgi:ribosome recycling factor
MSSTEIQTETKRKMEKTLEIMKDELKSIRTGRATPGLVENIKVSCYGSLTPLKQLANITAPEAQLIIISPYDPSILKDIEKAILQSELGLTTNSDGKVIRIPIPPLSGERREKIVTQIKND